jgi:hypothetical protein
MLACCCADALVFPDDPHAASSFGMTGKVVRADYAPPQILFPRVDLI